MKYQVLLPKPSAKRFTKCRLVVELSDGWQSYAPRTYDVDVNNPKFEFEVNDGFEYIRNTSISDGEVFDVYVDFSNKSGSRSERAYLVPMKV